MGLEYKRLNMNDGEMANIYIYILAWCSAARAMLHCFFCEDRSMPTPSCYKLHYLLTFTLNNTHTWTSECIDPKKCLMFSGPKELQKLTQKLTLHLALSIATSGNKVGCCLWTKLSSRRIQYYMSRSLSVMMPTVLMPGKLCMTITILRTVTIVRKWWTLLFLYQAEEMKRKDGSSGQPVEKQFWRSWCQHVVAWVSTLYVLKL